MEFRILGPLEVWYAGTPVAVGGARQRELLAVLLLHAGEVVSSDRLMDAVWGEHQPAAGTTALRVRVSQLRKALGPGGDQLVTRAPGYALMVERDSLDLARFERLLGEASDALGRQDAARARDLADRALALWHGPPLADFAYAPFAQAAVVRLEELRLAALELRNEADLALGRHRLIAGDLQAQVEENPLRERLWAQLMLALYRDGRQADALAAYRSARRMLVDEIGIEPGRELQRLEARILAQDPLLELAAQEPVPAAPRRVVLALQGRGVAPVAEQLALRGDHEMVLVDLVRDVEEVGAAIAALGTVRESARERGVEVRVAAFTSADRGADAVRLVAEQDAAVLIVAVPGDGLDGDVATILRGAVCDVVLVAGGQAAVAGGPVLVPFAGHEHDWAAAEVGAWLAGQAPLRLLGAGGRGGRDASRLLASASLALQRGVGVAAEPMLLRSGADAVVEAASGAGAVVVGLSDRWAREGLGKARREIAARAPCPVLVVRRGLRPGGLAPAQALTRFTWSGGV